MDVSWDQVLGWRLGQQKLHQTEGTPIDAARGVAGVQAQVMSSAELAIGIRTGNKPDSVAQALWSDRALVKVWAMRGTLHLLAADELPIWVAALKTRAESLRRGGAWEATTASRWNSSIA